MYLLPLTAINRIKVSSQEGKHFRQQTVTEVLSQWEIQLQTPNRKRNPTPVSWRSCWAIERQPCFPVFVLYLFHWRLGSRRKHLRDTFNHHSLGRQREPWFSKRRVCVGLLHLVCMQVLRPLFWALTASRYLFSVGPVVLCGRKGSVITPTFHKRKHKPRCAKGLSDLVYQLLGDRVEQASELSDLSSYELSWRAMWGEKCFLWGFLLTSVERGVFAFITSSTTSVSILDLHDSQN